MAYFFADGFDSYVATSDAYAGYWDSGTVSNQNLAAGRFVGSQCLSYTGIANNALAKSSGVNDAVHHIVLALRQTGTLTGTNLGFYLQFSDAATNQCCIVFRSDGVILLTSATPAGTTLATYSNAVTAQNAWFGFEFEVIISNTVGRFRARKNGNTADDFDSGATLNTRPGANPYANKLTLGYWSAAAAGHQFDDIVWRSDAASVPWMGDLRCLQQMPVSDVSAQFSKAPATLVQTVSSGTNLTNIVAGQALYSTGATATYDGTIGTVTLNLNVGYTGNMKCTLFSSNAGRPGTVLGTATLTNPTSGTNTLTFSSPPTVTKGATYFLGFCSDTAVTNGWFTTVAASGWFNNTTYAAFPATNPTVSGTAGPICAWTLTVGSNTTLVNETTQDGTTSYVYDSTVGHADLYSISPLPGPATIVAVTTRGFMAKSDAGARSGQVQVKSGGTTVQSTALSLSNNFLWSWRSDLTNPNGGAAWTNTTVNALQIGPVVQA